MTFISSATFFKINNIGWEHAVQHSIFGLGVNILCFYTYARFVVDPYLESKQYWKFAAGTFLTLLAFWILKYSIETQYIPAFTAFIEQSSKVPPKRFVFSSLFVTMLLSVILRTLENRIDRDSQQQAIINQHQEAQLLYLKSQINPHFLFNTLNNLYSLAVVKSDQTPKMILKLSDLLRYSIYDSQEEKVPLQKEVKQIQEYLALVSMTKEEPPNIQFNIQGDLSQIGIEPMILIPLVENGIKHGDFELNPKAYFKIDLMVNEKQLVFKTENSKNDVNHQKDQVGGVGLENIRKRLVLNHPEHEFDTQDHGDTFSTFLKINLG